MTETERKSSPKKKEKPLRTIKKIRAAKVINKISEKVRAGKMASVSAAMREVGYSESYSATPNRFIEQKNTQSLLDQYFPDDLMHKKTLELMDMSRLDSFTFPKRGKKEKSLTNDEIRYIVETVAGCVLIYIKDNGLYERVAYFRQVDSRARKDGLDIMNKLKGAYKTDAVNPLDRNPFAQMSDAELQAAIKEAKDVLRKKI